MAPVRGPRKVPQQERSRQMVERILLSAQEVLLTDGHDAASTNRTYYVNGTIDPSGAHTASLRADEVTFQLECEPGECGVSVDARPCASENNRALFRRLPPAPNGAAQWTCAALRQRRDVLPAASGRAPTRCTRETSNSAP